MLRASTGCSRPSPIEVNRRSHIGTSAPVGSGSNRGKRQASSSNSGGPCGLSSSTSRNCAGLSALPTGASCQPKREGQSWQEATRQRYKVDGSGLWCEGSVGSIPGLGIPNGSPPARADLRHSLRRQPRQPTGRPRQHPNCLMADRGYDSDPLRARSARRGIEPIVPGRRNHKLATHQEGRKRRRYRRRWIVERTLAWLGQFRHLVVRPERLITTYAGFLHLAYTILTLRRILK